MMREGGRKHENVEMKVERVGGKLGENEGGRDGSKEREEIREVGREKMADGMRRRKRQIEKG